LKKWLYRSVLEPLLALLRAGLRGVLAARQLALCMAIAIVVGNIPPPGRLDNSLYLDRIARAPPQIVSVKGVFA
jgi:hypothetical protein